MRKDGKNNKIYSILIMSIFTFSPDTKKEIFEMKNEKLCGRFRLKKKKVALDPLQWPHREGKGHDLPPDGKYIYIKLKYNVYNVSVFPPNWYFWVAH